MLGSPGRMDGISERLENPSLPDIRSEEDEINENSGRSSPFNLRVSEDNQRRSRSASRPSSLKSGGPGDVDGKCSTKVLGSPVDMSDVTMSKELKRSRHCGGIWQAPKLSADNQRGADVTEDQ